MVAVVGRTSRAWSEDLVGLEWRPWLPGLCLCGGGLHFGHLHLSLGCSGACLGHSLTPCPRLRPEEGVWDLSSGPMQPPPISTPGQPLGPTAPASRVLATWTYPTVPARSHPHPGPPCRPASWLELPASTSLLVTLPTKVFHMQPHLLPLLLSRFTVLHFSHVGFRHTTLDRSIGTIFPRACAHFISVFLQ